MSGKIGNTKSKDEIANIGIRIYSRRGWGLKFCRIKNKKEKEPQIDITGNINEAIASLLVFGFIEGVK